MDQPNVLLICTDHWPGKMIGALGHPAVFTPTIDQMAALGIAFTNAYATTPTCIPARRELMTGTFSKTHGDRVFDGKTPMPQPTIAQVFRDAGYHAYGVGKLHVNPPRDRIGFDDVLIHESGRLGNRDDQMAQDDYEHFLTERGYPGEESSYGIQKHVHLPQLAPARVLPLHQLDGAGDVPVHRQARPGPPQLLVHVLRRSSSAVPAASPLHGHLPRPGDQ